MPGKPDKTSHFSAYLGNLGGEIFMIIILFVCHGRTRTFVWNGLKSGLLGNENGICTPIVPLFCYFTDLLIRTVLDKKEIKIQLVPLDFGNLLDLFCQKYSYPMGTTLSLRFQPEKTFICFGSNWKRMILISMSLRFLGRAMTRSRNSSQEYPVEKCMVLENKRVAKMRTRWRGIKRDC